MNTLRNTVFIFLAGWVLHSCALSPGSRQQFMYKEPHRPQFHFSPAENWMNDPNGMFYFDGEYHLFYQHYPDSNVWGPMHWGHAVSADLVHWQHLPIALYPDSLGYIFSGSAVVDWNNTSGLGQNGRPPLVAIFTYHNPDAERAGRADFQYQGIAYSNDKGRTWTKYPGNPVVPNTQKIRDFRDPKVIWDEASQQWVMVFAAADHVKLWGSDNLIEWTHLSDFGKEWGSHGGVWECPDLFPIQVEGSNEKKWALLLSINPGAANGGSGTQYFVGNFDGKKLELDPTFAPDMSGERAVWLDYGRDNYAGVTWSDIPKEDGRRLFIGWMSNWDYAARVPTQKWRGATTIPRTLTLRKTGEGYRMFSEPVKELQDLRASARRLESAELQGLLDITDQIGAASPTQMELVLDFELPAGAYPDFGVQLSNSKGEQYRVGYNAAAKQFYSDRRNTGDISFSDKFARSSHTAPRLSEDQTIRMHLFIDASSAELFADGGATVLTDIFFPGEDFDQIAVYSEKGSVKLLKSEAFRLRSIWR